MNSRSREHFENLYRHDPDPWDFAVDRYEQDRYAALLSHVPACRYQRVFEPGCSVGVLTSQLARRCRHVLAIDIAEAAVNRARDRCRHLSNVELRRSDLSSVDPPTEPFDLVVFSEIGYYFDCDDLARELTVLRNRVTPEGRLVAQHWIGQSPDHALNGFAVHDQLGWALRHWDHRVHQVRPDSGRDGYVLDVWDRPPGALR